ncbi:unnamed protein product [Coregonus sp. 'balchen']|nr:unnamed protein product [Coregonus sp. 'balchen']
MQEHCSVLAEREYEMSCKVWNGKEVLGLFHTMGITADTFAMLQVCRGLPRGAAADLHLDHGSRHSRCIGLLREAQPPTPTPQCQDHDPRTHTQLLVPQPCRGV